MEEYLQHTKCRKQFEKHIIVSYFCFKILIKKHAYTNSKGKYRKALIVIFLEMMFWMTFSFLLLFTVYDYSTVNMYISCNFGKHAWITVYYDEK